jgi:hypothetical protein
MHETFFRQVLQRQPHPIVFASLSGAHLYGFPSPNSDYDLRGAHLLPLEQVIGLTTPTETWESSFTENGLELDIVSYDIRLFLELLLKKSGNILEQIYSPLVIQATPFLEELRQIAPLSLTRHHGHHYRGLLESQWKLFTAGQPPRVKPLLYVYRAALTGIHLLQTGHVESNLETLNEQVFHLPYLPDLIQRKREGAEHGGLTLTAQETAFHESEVQRLREALNEARESSHLPEQGSALPALNDLLIRLRLGQQ